MQTTPNYGLKKIELTDSPPDITVINPNWDTVDSELKNINDNKVDKVPGKQLSTEDYTTEEKKELYLHSIIPETSTGTTSSRTYTIDGITEMSQLSGRILNLRVAIGNYAATYQTIEINGLGSKPLKVPSAYRSGLWTDYIHEFSLSDDSVIQVEYREDGDCFYGKVVSPPPLFSGVTSGTGSALSYPGATPPGFDGATYRMKLHTDLIPPATFLGYPIITASGSPYIRARQGAWITLVFSSIPAFILQGEGGDQSIYAYKNEPGKISTFELFMMGGNPLYRKGVF